jgi:protein SCO1/2
VNKKALIAVLLVILVPLTAYFIIKGKSERNIHMPRHYLPDTVITVTKKGKQVDDTLWHQVKDFTLTNQEGRKISLADLQGKIIVADFFFTHCPTICPGMTMNMKKLAEAVHSGKRVGDRTNKQVHFISFSIDPERDSVPELKAWANRFQVNPEQWWLLTGDKKIIYDLALEEMKLGLVDGEGVDTNFIHSDRFVLLDSNRRVRGYYSGLDTAAIAQLANDMVMLTREKDPKGKSFFDGKLQLIAIVFLITLVGVFLFLYFVNKKRN